MADAETVAALVRRLQRIERTVKEQALTLNAVRTALAGKPVPNVALDFAVVQSVVDLVADRRALQERLTDVEAILHSRSIR